jgi:hypothetical protein
VVEVKLQDLVLGQGMLDLDGEEGFVDLAGKGFFRAQKEIARHLHGDGGSAFLGAAGNHVGQGRAQDPQRVHAAMLVETFVLGGEDGLAQKFGRIFYSHDSPTLFAKFADKSTILGKDAHGLLGAVVRQGLQAGQVGVDGRRGQSHHGGDRDGQSGEDGQQVLPPTGHLEREMMNGLNTKNVVEINELLLGFNPDY